MSNIKTGSCKWGIYPFNLNAIDKSLLLRNKLLPDTNINLAEPPIISAIDAATQTEENITDDIQSLHDMPQEKLVSSSNSIVLCQADYVGSASTSSVHITINEELWTNSTQSPTQVISSQNPNNNPLFSCGILSTETSQILFPNLELIPQGRKRPLKIQSKVPVMTAKDVQRDNERQQTEMNAKAMKRRKIDAPKGKASVTTKGQLQIQNSPKARRKPQFL